MGDRLFYWAVLLTTRAMTRQEQWLVHECGTRFFKHVVQHKHYNVLSPVFLEVFKHTNYNCYPNAGVMLVDQQRFNQLKLLERIEQLVKLNKVEFIYRLGSQPLVTLTTWGRYLPLDDKWNVIFLKSIRRRCCASALQWGAIQEFRVQCLERHH